MRTRSVASAALRKYASILAYLTSFLSAPTRWPRYSSGDANLEPWAQLVCGASHNVTASATNNLRQRFMKAAPLADRGRNGLGSKLNLVLSVAVLDWIAMK